VPVNTQSRPPFRLHFGSGRPWVVEADQIAGKRRKNDWPAMQKGTSCCHIFSARGIMDSQLRASRPSFSWC